MAGLGVPYNPTSNLPCDMLGSPPYPYCDNDEYFFSSAGSYLGSSLTRIGGVVIDDSGGDPLAIMWFSCGPQAVCDIQLLAESDGGPINLATVPVPFDALNTPTITAVDGVQDAIDVSFYNGASASYAFLLTTTPEPASVVLLATIFVGLGLAAKCKFHSSPGQSICRTANPRKERR